MRTVQCFLAMFLTVVLVTGANANTLDRRLITFNAGIIQLGGDLDSELSDVLDNIYTYGVGVQLPMNEYLVLLASVQRTTTSLNVEDIKGDITGLGFTGGVRLQMPLRELPLTPFVSAQYGHSTGELTLKAEGERMKLEQITGSITIGAGIEWSITDRLSVMGGFARAMEQSSKVKVDGENIDTDEIFDTDDTDIISASVLFWVTDNVLLSALTALEREEKTKTHQVAVGFSF